MGSVPVGPHSSKRGYLRCVVRAEHRNVWTWKQLTGHEVKWEKGWLDVRNSPGDGKHTHTYRSTEGPAPDLNPNRLCSCRSR